MCMEFGVANASNIRYQVEQGYKDYGYETVKWWYLHNPHTAYHIQNHLTKINPFFSSINYFDNMIIIYDKY